MTKELPLVQHDVCAPRCTLRILGTSDVHMNLLGHDYYSDTEHPFVGLSRTARLISEARAEVAATGGLSLLLDNGDWMQGTPLGDVAIASPDTPHPAILAFEHLQYDAIGLGNHEFDYGLDALDRVLQTAHCPVLCSNLTVRDPKLRLPVQRRVILERHVPGAPRDLRPIRIGLFSVLPPQTMKWDADLLHDRVDISDMVDCARAQVRALRDEGADVVIALAHTGIGAANATPRMENALIPISAIQGLDAAIGGHTHLLYPPQGGMAQHDPAFAIPVVIPGPSGAHLGQIDFDLSFDGSAWKVLPRNSGLRAITPVGANGQMDGTPEDPQMTDKLQAAHARTRAAINVSVGHTTQSLHSYFTFIGEDRALALVAQAQAAAVRPALAASPYAALPMLSAISPAKFGGRGGARNYTDVSAGPLSRRHVADLYAFPNEARCAVINGQQLLDWLEMSACFFHQLLPSHPTQPLIDPERVGHNFDVVFGIEYDIDVTAPGMFDAFGNRLGVGAGRIRNLRWQGALVTADQQFAVALNSYRMSGGGNFRMLEGTQQIALPPQQIREALEAYVTGTKNDPLAETPQPWRFTPNLGVQATTLTGPGAARYLSELPPNVTATPTVRADGFMELRLSL